MYSNIFPENGAVYGIMWKNMVDPEGHRWQYNKAYAQYMQGN